MFANEPIPPDDEVHLPHAHTTPHKQSWFDKALSISAIVISLASITISVHHGQIMQEIQKTNHRSASALVWPNLSMSLSNTEDGKPAHTIQIKNTGTGPARLQSLQVFYSGKPIRNFYHLLTACCGARFDAGMAHLGIAGRENDENHTSRRTIQNYDYAWDIDISDLKIETSDSAPNVLAANQTLRLVKWELSASVAPLWHAFNDLRFTSQIKARACYCSVLDECWITEFDSTTPNPIAQCPKEEIQFQAAR